jgi:hypothetical protein
VPKTEPFVRVSELPKQNRFRNIYEDIRSTGKISKAISKEDVMPRQYIDPISETGIPIRAQ